MKKLITLFFCMTLLIANTASFGSSVIEKAPVKKELSISVNSLDCAIDCDYNNSAFTIETIYIISPEVILNKVNYNNLNFNGKHFYTCYFPGLTDIKLSRNKGIKRIPSPGNSRLIITSHTV